jgi:arylsulfatase A-like enzyme
MFDPNPTSGRFSSQSVVFKRLAICLACLAILPIDACRGRSEPVSVDPGTLPIHLEERIDTAEIFDSGQPVSELESREWAFGQGGARWKVVADPRVNLETSSGLDAMRFEITSGVEHAEPLRVTAYTPVEGIKPEDWDSVVVKARGWGDARKLGLRFNHRDTPYSDSDWLTRSDEVPILADGAVHTYRLRTDLRVGIESKTWSSMGLVVETETGADSTFELISVVLVPRASRYSRAPAGVVLEGRSGTFYRSIFQRSSGRLRYSVRVPKGGNLSFAAGIASNRHPASFCITVIDKDREVHSLIEEVVGDSASWIHRSVDLRDWENENVDLELECKSQSDGAVCLWAAPTLSGTKKTKRPNIILYLIDGAGADYLSAYGYPRETTPNIDQLAEQGVLFERAHSNSSWTKPSTATLMTSLHHKLLGGFSTFADPLPEKVETIAERLHCAGYQTSVLVSNPFAGRVSSLSRGVDFLRDTGVPNTSVSSKDLHDEFWSWRQRFPGAPFWVHFQTTDVHSPYLPEDPREFVTESEVDQFRKWQKDLNALGGNELHSLSWAEAGIDRAKYLEIQRKLYEECLAHNDRQIGDLVDSLKKSGEWENTILVITSDHGARAAGLRLGGLKPSYRVLASSHETRIPLIVVWPGHFQAGSRVQELVSLIDLKPTLLDLVGVDSKAVFQGRSLVPYLRGEKPSQETLIVLEEIQNGGTGGDERGLIEVVDGRWAASLQIGRGLDPVLGGARGVRPTDLLLFDLKSDPLCLKSLHELRPDDVRRYREILQKIWRQHVELSKEFTSGVSSELGKEQLEALRALGYIS